MILATVILIVSVVVFGITYAVVVLPLEYTVDALQEAYTEISTEMGWTDAAEVNQGLGANTYFLAAAVVFGIILLFVWYFAYAQKFEHERY